MTITVGDPAPDFNLTTDQGKRLTLSELKGQKVVVYFYPRDSTPGCTQESCDFRDNYQDLQNQNVVVLGISADSQASHQKFKTKYDLPFPLLVDDNHQACQAYAVYKEKSMYGKKYFGIERSTFLIDENGKLRAIWRKVKVGGHIDEVKKAVEAL